MPVKGNQPPLQHDIPVVCHEAQTLAETRTATETVDSGHGRIEQRRLTASSALVGYRDGPGLAQVFQRVFKNFVMREELGVQSGDEPPTTIPNRSHGP
jgi:hypothetical protein